jgi:histone acetyltransferase (RNA polymerase elongator complex component)
MTADRTVIIPVFVPNFGCPHHCCFCDQRQITGVSAAPREQDILELIAAYQRTAAPGANMEIAFYGGSFTLLPLALQEQLLRPAYQALVSGEIRRIRVSTRPDGINEAVLTFLRNWGVSLIELGVQSLDPEVLRLCRRGHTAAQSLQAITAVQTAGFQLGVQLMVGLPGDNPAKALATARQVAALRPDFVRIYPALVLKGTGLEAMYRSGTYSPLPLREAVELAADLLLLFARAGIPVIRVGLQPNEALLSGDSLVAGPFHPSFRELAEAEIIRRQLTACLDQVPAGRLDQEKQLNLFVSPRDLSRARGERGGNLEYLRHRYGFARVKVVPWPSLVRGDFGLAPGKGKVPVWYCLRQEFIASCRI